MNVIRSNGYKTAVSYKTVQSLFWCSCTECKCYFFTYLQGFMFQKTCFTNQMFYVRNIPIHSYTINKNTFIINTITTIIIIIIIIIIFNFNITIIIIINIITIIIIIIIITIIIKSTIIIIIFSFILHFFNIRSLCVTFIFEFICVLFNYLIFIIYWL